MKYLCNICNTSYKTSKTLLNHNNKFHNIDETTIIFNCPHCDNKFTRKNNMVLHIKNKCKNKKEIDEKTLIEKQLIEMQKKIEVLENNNKTTNINNGNINNTTNNINNVIYINKTGTESLLELNDKEITEIFSKEISGIVSLIKFINFNERLPSNHSFCTKSLEGKYLLTYNTDESKIESTRKKYFYQELISTAVDKMELLYKVCKNKFAKEKQTRINDTIQRLKEIKERDFSDTILREIKNQLIQLSYNCRNTVLHTWDNNKIEGKKDIIDKEFDDLFIKIEAEQYESDSETSCERPQLIINIASKKDIKV